MSERTKAGGSFIPNKSETCAPRAGARNHGDRTNRERYRRSLKGELYKRLLSILETGGSKGLAVNRDRRQYLIETAAGNQRLSVA
jgi:hypothetical protein